MDGAPGLRINLLGELTASFDGAPLDLGGRRQRAVLAVLLLARGEAVSAESLAEAVWGEHAPRNALSALQAYVSHLRRCLQPGAPARTRSAVIAREGPGYAVHQPPEGVDAWRFESLLARADRASSADETAALLREALGLWRGPALADYADEPWAEPEIARLAGLRGHAHECLMAARLRLGEAAILVPELESLVAEEPLREERWRLLALALYRAHRQADALAALRRARRTLDDELGVDPGPALRELEAEVLAQSPSLDLPIQRVAEPPPNGRAPQGAAPPDDLVERVRELSALARLLDGFPGRSPGLLLIEGPGGIGKTRLLERARAMAAERSVRVLAGRGSRMESAFAFGVARQLFEPEVAGPARRAELLAGPAATARGVFELTDDSAGEGSFAVIHGLYWLTVGLTTTGPLVLAIDDAQWCDTASLRFLAYLARRLSGVPVLLALTVRTDEINDDQDLLAELTLEPGATVLRPQALSVEATAVVVERRLGEPPAERFTAACHRTTSGVPLLLDQLLRALASDGVRPDASHADAAVALGSRAVSSMILLRLRRLPAGAVEVAQAASVLGDGAPLPAVAALTDLSESQTATMLTVLARAGILKEQRPLAFVNPLVRDGIYHGLPGAERELCHERAAEVLHAAGASDEQVAAHLLLSPSRGRLGVVTLLRSAAACAADRGSPDSALTYLRRALLESETGSWRRDVLHQVGLLEAMLGGSSVEEGRATADEAAGALGAAVSSGTQVGGETMHPVHGRRPR